MILPRFYFADEFIAFRSLFLDLGTPIQFKQGSYLCEPGEPLKEGFYIVEGLTSFGMIHEGGEVINAMYLGKNEIFPLVCSEMHFAFETTLFLKACTDVVAIPVSYETLGEVLRNQEFARTCIEHYCRYTNLMLTRITGEYSSSLVRVADFLYLYLYHKPNAENIIRLSQQEIGATIGLSHAQLARCLQTLRDDAVIETKRGFLQVLSMEKLRAYGSYISDPHR